MTATRPLEVAVLIPSWDGLEHLKICLEALENQHAPGIACKTWVFDNGSTDGTREWLERQHPTVRVLRSEHNLGFAAAVNRLVAAAEGCEYVAMLNNDTRPTSGWLAALVDCLARAPADVAAVSGLIVDWEGERLDFARGAVTFDGHAFQVGYRRPLDTVELPATGEELPFACGGNLIVRRDAFREVGGFDASYFAYYEDVDLGWRLWARGYRILFCAEARIHHHSSATSDRLGLHHRGYLFERNAFLTAYKNLDETLWPRLMPAILLTLLNRTQTLMVERNPGGGLLTVDPYAGLIAATRGVEGERSSHPAESLFSRLRRHGLRGSLRQARLRLGQALIGSGTAKVELTCEQTVAQLRVVSALLGGLETAASMRRIVQAQRRRPDAEYLERFPLYLVATYPGDETLFADPGFRAWIDSGDPPLPIVRAALSDLMEWP